METTTERLILGGVLATGVYGGVKAYTHKGSATLHPAVVESQAILRKSVLLGVLATSLSSYLSGDARLVGYALGATIGVGGALYAIHHLPPPDQA